MAASIWLQVTDPFPRPIDPVREAWHLSKLALQALRYRYLTAGHLDTSARAVLFQLCTDPQADALQAATLLEAFDVAREFRPPPMAGVVPQYRRAAAACLRWIASSLCSPGT
jgi:hypothetical protein